MAETSRLADRTGLLDATRVFVVPAFSAVVAGCWSGVPVVAGNSGWACDPSAGESALELSNFLQSGFLHRCLMASAATITTVAARLAQRSPIHQRLRPAGRRGAVCVSGCIGKLRAATSRHSAQSAR